jgi:ABC-type glutathione transport system ATPase component
VLAAHPGVTRTGSSGVPLLEVEGLTKRFPVRRGMLGRLAGVVRAVDAVSFRIEPGTTLGLVGESGCGKTTTARLILGLEPPTAGAIRFAWTDVLRFDRDGLRGYGRAVQAVFQDPFASLDPRMRVRDTIAEPLVINERGLGAVGRRRRVLELPELVGLPPRSADLYPHEFSGGPGPAHRHRQPLALSPRLVVLDESVSALDVSIRAQILNLVRDPQERLSPACPSPTICPPSPT